jgi:hypothetical protein
MNDGVGAENTRVPHPKKREMTSKLVILFFMKNPSCKISRRWPINASGRRTPKPSGER